MTFLVETKNLVALSLVGLIMILAGGYLHLKKIPASELRPTQPPLRILAPASPTPTPTPKPKPKPIKLLFGGDLMFDRDIRRQLEKQGVDSVFSELKPLFQTYDGVIANLEGPVTSFPSKSVGSAVGSSANFTFTFNPSVIPMLKEHNFTVVNLGNNHINNFGQAGMKQTKRFLAEASLAWFGNTGSELTSSERIHVVSDVTPTLAFVNYNQFVDGGWETALIDVHAATELAEVVIVMPHWGNEYQMVANQVIQQQAHQLIDAGADLIIGSHPHVVQQTEVYQGKTIYYSLGNFVFDQYFQPEVQRGLLVGVTISPNGEMSFTDIEIQLQRNGPVVIRPQR